MKTTKLSLCIAFASLAFGLRGEEVDPRLFARKVELTVYGSSGSGAVENFPLLVRLDPEKITGFSYASFTRDDGSDMMFHDAEGNEIPHDIDTWNTQGESLVWVRVPYLSGNQTKLTLYFGRDEGATGNFSRADVWSRYAAVWHLNEGDSDATGHGLAAAPHGGGTTPESNDILGHGYSNSGLNQNRLLLDSPGDYVSSIDSESSLLSVSCWVKLNGNPDTKRLVCWKNDYAETKGCELIESSDGVMLRASNGSGSATPVALVSWNKTAWTHIVGV